MVAGAFFLVLTAGINLVNEAGRSIATGLPALGVPALAALSTAVCGAYLLRGKVRTRIVRRVTFWTLLGAAFVGSVAVLVLVHWRLYGSGPVTEASDATVVLTNAASGGAVLGLLTGMADVERAAESRRFERSEERYRRLVDSSTDAIVTCGEDRVIEQWNEAATETFGYEEAQALGRGVDDLLVPETYREEHVEGFERYLRTGEGRIMGETVELEALHQDASVFPVEVSLSDTESEGSRRVTAIIRDVRHRKRMEEELSVFDRLLRHNLRNQASLIVGAAQLVTERVDDPEVEEQVRDIVESAERLTEQADKARVARRAFRERDEWRTPVDAAGIVRQAVQDARSKFSKSDISLDSPETCHVLGTGALRHAVSELVENSVVHSDRERPKVEVSVTQVPDEDRVEIRVADDGPGIPEGERRVLDEGRETPLDHSAGVGLWLVKWLVDLQRGDLSFGEDESRGAAIAISLAAAPDGANR